MGERSARAAFAEMFVLELEERLGEVERPSVVGQFLDWLRSGGELDTYVMVVSPRKLVIALPVEVREAVEAWLRWAGVEVGD